MYVNPEKNKLLNYTRTGSNEVGARGCGRIMLLNTKGSIMREK